MEKGGDGRTHFCVWFTRGTLTVRAFPLFFEALAQGVVAGALGAHSEAQN